MSLHTSIKSRPFKCNGNPMDDRGFINLALESLDTYEKKTGQPAPINPMFYQWLKQGKTAIDGGENVVDYKKRTIVKLIPNYEHIIENTKKNNKKRSK